MQTEIRYLPPHRTEGCILENVAWEKYNAIRAIAPQRIFAQTNPITQSGEYEEFFSFSGVLGSIMQPPVGVNGN